MTQKRGYSTMLLIGCMVLFFSCKKSTGSDGSTSKEGYYIKAKLNGEEKIFLEKATSSYGYKDKKVIHLVLSARSTKTLDPDTAYDIEIWEQAGNITEGGTYYANVQSRYAVNANNLTTQLISADYVSPRNFKTTITQMDRKSLHGILKE